MRWRRDKKERVTWLESRSSEVDLVVSVLGFLLVTMVLLLRGEPFGIENQYERLTLAMLIALWSPPIAAWLERTVRPLFEKAPLRSARTWTKAIKLGEQDGVTSVLAGSDTRSRDWVLLRFGEREQAERFVNKARGKSEDRAAIPSGESTSLGYLREVARVGSTAAIVSYLWNVSYDGGSMKPVFGIAALFLGGLVLTITAYRFAQRGVPATFYRAIVDAMLDHEKVSHQENRLPLRSEGESYSAWLTRLSGMLSAKGENAYRGAAALQTPALETTAREGTEDERLAASWLLGRMRVAVDPAEPKVLQRVVLAETPEEAEAAMLEIEPGTLRRRVPEPR